MTKPDAARDVVLALDQGGHASRALVFDTHGRVLARSVVTVEEQRYGVNRVEQDPEDLVRSIQAAAGNALLRAERSVGDVVRAGLATQRSSLVCWDRESGSALSPVLSWQDRRAHAWLERFVARDEDIRRRTGLRLSAHYGASKLRWCLDHLPAVIDAHARGRLACGPLASFLAFRLCSERPLVADPANASRTLLFDVRALEWDPELCDLFRVPREVLPSCVPTRNRHGALVLGDYTAPLEILTGDQSAAVFAWGEPREDSAYVNLGTGAFVQRPVPRMTDRLPRLLASIVALDGGRATFVVEGTVNGAGSALRSVAAELGLEAGDVALAEALEGELDPPLFLNGVSGLGAPYWVPAFRSHFVGEGSPRAKLVAVAESVVFLVATILEEMHTALAPAARIVASGGLAEIDGLCQRLADLARTPVERALEHEATSRGLATLLGAPLQPALRTVFAPHAASALQTRYRRFRQEIERTIGT